MGILDKYSTPQEKEDLAEKMKSATITDGGSDVSKETNLTEKQNQSSVSKKNAAKKKTKKKDEVTITEEPTDDEVILFVREANNDYKSKERKDRLISIQEDFYRQMHKLKIHNVSMSKFVNVAIKHLIKSEDYNKIVQTLKKTK